MTWAHIVAARGLAPDARAQQVLTELAAYATETGKAWPSQKTIASNTKLSRSTVQLALDRLKAKALISVIEAASRDGSPATYLLSLPNLSAGLASQSVQTDLARLSGTRSQNDNQPSPNVAFASPTVGHESSGRNLRETPERAGARDPAGAHPAQEAERNPDRSPLEQAAYERGRAALREMSAHLKANPAFPTPGAPHSNPVSVASGNGIAKHIPTDADRLLEIERRRRIAAELADVGTPKE